MNTPNLAIITESMIWHRIPVRQPDTHKGNYGSVLALCGCENYRGAAALCTLGALRSGAGLVTLAAPETVISSVACQILEATFLPLPNELELLAKIKKTTVCAVGCGKKESAETARETELVLHHANGTVALDAGGLCSLVYAADNAVRSMRACAGRLIITPHAGEMAKLTGLPIAQILENPTEIASDYAAVSGAVVVLKGHHTVIAAPDGALYENHTGNAGLARGGSGDLLTGIIAGLAAQGLSPLDAAICGVWLHGSAANRCARRLSMMGMLPSDILTDLGQIFLENGR